LASTSSVATLLAGGGDVRGVVAIYAATDRARSDGARVKALNERREQLKAGIVASTSKRRAKLTNQNETTDRMRTLLKSLKVLQDEPAQAGAASS
jgi:tight adherence protein C